LPNLCLKAHFVTNAVAYFKPDFSMPSLKETDRRSVARLNLVRSLRREQQEIPKSTIATCVNGDPEIATRMSIRLCCLRRLYGLLGAKRSRMENVRQRQSLNWPIWHSLQSFQASNQPLEFESFSSLGVGVAEISHRFWHNYGRKPSTRKD
jgi:hypothetical protein